MEKQWSRDLQACNLIKKRLQCVSFEYCEIFLFIFFLQNSFAGFFRISPFLQTLPSRNSPAPTKQLKDQNNIQSHMSKANKKDTTTLLNANPVFIFNFKQILHIGLVFQLLTLNKQILAGQRLSSNSKYMNLSE